MHAQLSTMSMRLIVKKIMSIYINLSKLIFYKFLVINNNAWKKIEDVLNCIHKTPRKRLLLYSGYQYTHAKHL